MRLKQTSDRAVVNSVLRVTVEASDQFGNPWPGFAPRWVIMPDPHTHAQTGMAIRRVHQEMTGEDGRVEFEVTVGPMETLQHAYFFDAHRAKVELAVRSVAAGAA